RAVAIVAAPGWHPGVIGIVAGRLKEKLHRPAIVVALGEDGIGKGSGRSISGVDLGAAVLAAMDSGLLIAGGGHAMAAGLTVAGDGIEALADFLDERLSADVARSRDDRALLLDALLAPGGINATYCDALEAGGPYGAGWPGPLVAAGDDGRRIKAIAFRMADSPLGEALLAAPPHRRLWLAGRLKRDDYHGGGAAELHLEDAAWA